MSGLMSKRSTWLSFISRMTSSGITILTRTVSHVHFAIAHTVTFFIFFQQHCRKKHGNRLLLTKPSAAILFADNWLITSEGFPNNMQLATWNFVAWQVGCKGGNTGNKALQLAKQQCCAISCKEMLLVLLRLNEKFSWLIHSTERIK